MAVKKNARVPRKRQHLRVEKIVKVSTAPMKKMKKRKALIIAQEIKFARLLANNDKRVRDKMLKNLKKWLKVRSESSFAFTEADFMRLWKGLFYCMWMSDKPLIQEELAESLSNIVHCFDSTETALLYTKCTLKTLATEWFGIDQYRLDKFQMLARRIVRQTFEMCRQKCWDEKLTKGAASVMENILLDSKTTLGFSLHVTELYMEELAKIGGGSIPPNLVTELLRPFAVHLAAMDDDRQIRHVMKHIFRYLMFQSDVGMDYMEKFEAWRNAGFPCGNIDAMEKVEESEDDSEADEEDEREKIDDEDESDEDDKEEPETSGPKALDPRAGRVDVELPQLPFDPLEIAKMIKQHKFHVKSTAKTRRQIARLIAEFSQLAEGNMPLGVKEVDLPQRKNAETNPKKAAYRLLEFEKDLYSDTIRRKRKRKQIEPLVEDDEGFENLLTPIDQDEPETNGFHDADEYSDIEFGDDDQTMELQEAESSRISPKSNKKKNKKTSHDSNSIEFAKKSTNKKQKKDKIFANQNGVHEGIKKEDKVQSESMKNVKVKSKKSKTKKFLSVISTLNQKLLNRSSNESPTKAKKSRLSTDSTWDVSTNDVASTVAPKSPKNSKNIGAKVTETKVTSSDDKSSPSGKIVKEKTTTESNGELSSSNITKDQISKIPWLLPVLTKLEDEQQLKTPPKSTPEAQCGSSAKKRVKIMLRRNTAQLTSEYMRQLRQNPSIPYDANRKPLVGVLKPSPLSSPVNPFYKRT